MKIRLSWKLTSESSSPQDKLVTACQPGARPDKR